MKSILKAFVAHTLALLAKAVVEKYRPLIVMVTGSVGKTSTKDAAAAVLSSRYHLRASEKSYNSEFGVPLTIIGAKNPWNNPVEWIRVFREAFALILLPSHYPKLLVLEVGADRPGDLARILAICKPDAVIVTRLPDVPVHVEAYASPQAVRDEEFAPAYALANGAPLIISADDPNAVTMASRLSATITTFGFSEGSDIRLEGYSFFEDGAICGMEAVLNVNGVSHTLRVPGALGKSQLYAPAAAIACALSLDTTLAMALKGAEDYIAPAGRGRIIPGKNGSLLIDDSYNASPAAVEEALGALQLLSQKGRRIAVLGDMLELGRYSAEEHERIGILAASLVDVLIAVGVRSRATANAARKAGMREDRVFAYDTSDEAADMLEAVVQEGDVVLVKGSQSIRTERIAERLVRNPEDRSKLVRQETEWKAR